MTGWRTGWILVKNDLLTWINHKSSMGAEIATLLVISLALAERHADSRPLFVAVLGGPSVRVIQGRLIEGLNGWTWFMTCVLFAISVTGLFDTPPEWVRLTLIRTRSRSQWALARLVALLALALGFFAILMGFLAGAVVTGITPGPFTTWTSLWDVALWALGLLAMGWFEMALTLLTRSVWWGLSATFLLLGLAAFGGQWAPFIPFAQWIVAMHNHPGTLSITQGILYLSGWTVFWGGAVLGTAPRS